jgi:phosphoesterase RecJ-like protein
VDVSKIALTFGGGGHKNAAGFELVGSIEEIKEKLVQAFSFLK